MLPNAPVAVGVYGGAAPVVVPVGTDVVGVGTGVDELTGTEDVAVPGRHWE